MPKLMKTCSDILFPSGNWTECLIGPSFQRKTSFTGHDELAGITTADTTLLGNASSGCHPIFVSDNLVMLRFVFVRLLQKQKRKLFFRKLLAISICGIIGRLS